MIRNRLKIKYERSVVESHRKHFNEIKTIFSTYNHSKKDKLKKHFPLVYGLSYDRIFTKYKANIRTVSCSLLSTDIKDQLIEFINTAERRLNWISVLGSMDINILLLHYKLGFDCPLPSMYSHQIVKYNKKEIVKHFTKLNDINYDIMYKIYTENFHLYADISSSHLCNFILICCVHSTKTFHTLFYFDKDYIRYPLECYKNTEYIKDLFTMPYKI